MVLPAPPLWKDNPKEIGYFTDQRATLSAASRNGDSEKPHPSTKVLLGRRRYPSLVLANIRAYKSGSNVQQTRPPLIKAPGKPCKRHFRLQPITCGRRSRSGGARLICITSGEPSSDHGNMALNGAGEYLGCLSSGRGVQEAVLSISLCLFLLDVDDFTWEPPTEAETKVLQARRERQDRISRLMGDYLLRGYRMLGDTCADCGVRPEMRLRPRTKPHDLSSPLFCGPCLSGLPMSIYFLVPRRSSCKINSGKSTAWLVRSSTQTWIKIIRVRVRVCPMGKRTW